MLAVLLPSRGTISSKLMEAVDRLKVPHHRYFSHDRPIPDSHEYVAESALKSGCDWFWFLEEDVVPPENALELMMEMNKPIVHIPYYLHASRVLSFNLVGTRVVWIALGCTLISATVFRQMQRPWFKTEFAMAATSPSSRQRDWTLSLVPNRYAYGNLDVYFSFHALQLGYELTLVDGVLADHVHLRGNEKQEKKK